MLVTVSPSIRGSSQLGLTNPTKTKQVLTKRKEKKRSKKNIPGRWNRPRIRWSTGACSCDMPRRVAVLAVWIHPSSSAASQPPPGRWGIAACHQPWRFSGSHTGITNNGRLEKEFDTQKNQHPEKQLIIKYEISTIYIYISNYWINFATHKSSKQHTLKSWCRPRWQYFCSLWRCEVQKFWATLWMEHQLLSRLSRRMLLPRGSRSG